MLRTSKAASHSSLSVLCFVTSSSDHSATHSPYAFTTGHAGAGMAEFFAKSSADVYAKSVYRNLLQAPSGATAAAAASAAATSAASAASAAAAATGKLML